MSQEIATSGISSTAAVSEVIVTYDRPQFPYGLPQPNPARSQDRIPGFMYLMGHVIYEKDNRGNIIARNV